MMYTWRLETVLKDGTNGPNETKSSGAVVGASTNVTSDLKAKSKLQAKLALEAKMGDKPIIFIIGGPGSGKGTICERIKAQYGFTHLSTGDLLRDEVNSGSEKGRQLNEIMKIGQLVSNDQVLDLLKTAIERDLSNAKGFLIDGYPRQVNQAIDFEASIAPATLILHFHCSDEEMTSRLLNRGKTSGRVDDNAETIKKRLNTFHENTKPILEHFQVKLKTVNTERPVDEVFNEVDTTLKQLLKI